MSRGHLSSSHPLRPRPASSLALPPCLSLLRAPSSGRSLSLSLSLSSHFLSSASRFEGSERVRSICTVRMLSHVEMAPAAGGFKLFGKVITQCAESAPPASRGAAFARVREDPDERDQPVVKREVPADHADALLADRHHRPGGGAGVLPAPAESAESKGHHQHPRGAARQGQQQQETAEARAAAAASSAPPLPCPRCRSRNTKFCYFNNYNVNQPRHFCKDCHRYWTAGGALRNVPVGAGRRKNRPLGPVVAVPVPAAAAHHHQHLQHRAVAAGFVLGFPGQQHPPSPTSPSPPVYADRWPVCPERPLF